MISSIHISLFLGLHIAESWSCLHTLESRVSIFSYVEPAHFFNSRCQTAYTLGIPEIVAPKEHESSKELTGGLKNNFYEDPSVYAEYYPRILNTNGSSDHLMGQMVTTGSRPLNCGCVPGHVPRHRCFTKEGLLQPPKCQGYVSRRLFLSPKKSKTQQENAVYCHHHIATCKGNLLTALYV